MAMATTPSATDMLAHMTRLQEDLPRLQSALEAVQTYAERARLVVAAQQYLVTWAGEALGPDANQSTLAKAWAGILELEQAKQDEGAAFEVLLRGMNMLNAASTEETPAQLPPAPTDLIE